MTKETRDALEAAAVSFEEIPNYCHYRGVDVAEVLRSRIKPESPPAEPIVPEDIAKDAERWKRVLALAEVTLDDNGKNLLYQVTISTNVSYSETCHGACIPGFGNLIDAAIAAAPLPEVKL